MADVAPQPDPPPPASKSRRRNALIILGVLVLCVLAAVLAWQLLVGRWHVTTENAYTGAESAQVTAQVAGTVAVVLVSEAQTVEAGQLLARLDPADAEIALASAQANLEKTRRTVAQMFAQRGVGTAQIAARAADARRADVSVRQAGADARRAQADVRRFEAGTLAALTDLERLRAQATQLDAQARQLELVRDRLSADLARRAAASSEGAVSDEAMAHARSAVREAEQAWQAARSGADVARATLATATSQIQVSRAAADAAIQQARTATEGTSAAADSVDRANADLQAARQQLAAGDALIQGTTVDTHPDVLAAEARVRQAELDLARTEVRAPIAGIIARRSIQTGQRVAAGAPMMVVVPVERLYVDANFKESQLARVMPGQPVEMTSDLYGNSVVYHGRVVGIGGGTGSAFALLPAQNATGNWIKVVQRVPVRIALDPAELAEHPLRVGLSMDVSINTRPQSASRPAGQEPGKTTGQGPAR
jgi:membrane fusion protein, multidrug efflux system